MALDRKTLSVWYIAVVAGLAVAWGWLDTSGHKDYRWIIGVVGACASVALRFLDRRSRQKATGTREVVFWGMTVTFVVAAYLLWRGGTL